MQRLASLLRPAPSAGAAWRSPLALAGLAAVAAARLLTLPASLWEYDEVLFVRGVERFEPLSYRPHPPGYPLLVGLGKAMTALVGDRFHALVALSVLASLVGYLALVDGYARLAGGVSRDAAQARLAGVAGALLFALSPPMLLYGPLALSDPPALALAALAFAAAARLVARPSIAAAFACGAFAAAAIGCRPQLVVALAPALLVVAAMAALAARRPRWAPPPMVAPSVAAIASRPAQSPGAPVVAPPTAAAPSPRAELPNARWVVPAMAVGFAAVTAGWLLPLLAASGGVRGLLRLLGAQAGLVASNDASLARAGSSAGALLARFLVDPWGPRWAAVAVLGLAAAGGVLLLRGRAAADMGAGADADHRPRPSGASRAAALPLLVFAAVDLAFALAAMNPGDAARYAMPSMLAVAFLAGCGCAALRRLRHGAALAWLLPAALLSGFVVYTAPLLRQRATVASPPVQAAAWARTHVPAGALVLYERELESHALELLAGWKRLPADGRVASAADRPAFLLAEGPSAAPGGATFRWAEGPAWRNLTRRHLGVVSWTPVSAGRLFEPLTGVYGPEPSALAWLRRERAGDSWRWLSDRASLRVRPAGAPAVDVALRLPASAPYPQLVVAIEVAGSVQPEVRLRRGETVALRLPLPAARRVRIDLRADRSFVPADAGITAGDRRRLALQLVRFELVRPPGAGS